MSLEKLIRKETGVGALSPQHMAWLQTLVKVAFRSKSSVLIFYAEHQKNSIYLFPTDEPNSTSPRQSIPLVKEKFNENIKKANDMLKTINEQTECFAILAPYYKIKIVRELPAKVKTSDKISNFLV
jgi:hypothetical protein